MQSSPSPSILSVRPDANDIAAIYEHFATAAVTLFNAEGSVPPSMFLVELGDGSAFGQVGQVDPAMTELLFSSGSTKEKVGRLIGGTLDPDSPVRANLKRSTGLSPDVVVTVVEAWAVIGTFELTDGIPASQHPDRKEVLTVSVHVRGRSWVGLCPISVSGDAKVATYAPLDQSMTMEGRLMPPQVNRRRMN